MSGIWDGVLFALAAGLIACAAGWYDAHTRTRVLERTVQDLTRQLRETEARLNDPHHAGQVLRNRETDRKPPFRGAST